MKMTQLFLAIAFVGFAWSAFATTANDHEVVEELWLTGAAAAPVKCRCHALDSNPFSEGACNALPVSQCGRVGNIICYPVCR